MSQRGFHQKHFAPSRHRAIAIVGCSFWAVCLHASSAQPPTVTTAAVSRPAELALPVSAGLSTDVVTVTAGTTKLEFWWVKSLPLRDGASGAPSWSDVPDGSLVGALRLGATWTDIRGYTVRPGVYTLRFALQPQNGDHVGISPNREFLLPAPAADDMTLEPVGYDGAVALASKSSRRAHPASISIDPPGSTARPLSAATNDLGHQIVIVSVPTSAGTPLTFGLVVEGTIDQ
ncbi:MAG: hypothetical protein JJE40_01475 [Vicinamibacteria bacterium]|nr:hypothetical protein [Vicinamibacteria bacterium]